MRIAVTGATGRVGRPMVKSAVEDGHEVLALDRVLPAAEAAVPGAEYVQVDTTDYEGFSGAMRGCDGLVHLAAYPNAKGRTGYETFNNNVVSSYNALTAAVALGMRRVCQASSNNALGATYSRHPVYEYLPLDEEHPTHNEDPYALSKWVCEEQAHSLCRRHEDLAIATMRFAFVCPSREEGLAMRDASGGPTAYWHDLWGYTVASAAARACLDALTGSWLGSEVFYLVAPRTLERRPTAELVAEFYPEVALRHSLRGDEGLYDCSKAERLLNWKHPVD